MSCRLIKCPPTASQHTLTQTDRHGYISAISNNNKTVMSGITLSRSKVMAEHDISVE